MNRIFIFLLLLTTGSCTPHLPNLSLAQSATNPHPDPFCLSGVPRGTTCCPASCIICGGPGCSLRGKNDLCCINTIRNVHRNCNNMGPPCISSQTFPTPSITPSVRPSANPTPCGIACTPQIADPTCMRGIRVGGICCPSECGFCGGRNCATRPPGGGACCIAKWLTNERLCSETAAPCNMNRISDVEIDMTEVIMSSFAPIETPDAEMESGRGVWETLDVRGRPSRRYEGCMVMVNGLGYLIGGRGMKDVSILDPVQKSWRNTTGPGFEMHHMQCVVYELKIWIVSCWTGKFPMEEAVEHVWMYNVVTDTWERRQGLPKGRRRGAGASVLHDGKIWVVGGNQGGHGGHSNTLGYVDYYDLLLDKWVLQLAELPEGRDHVGGAIVNVGHEQQLCISGGRDSGRTNVLTAIISSTFCYSFSRNEWVDMKNDIPVGRAGAAVTSTCDGKMMVAGGEAMLVYDRVDIFDGVTWSETGRLNTARHGAGIAVSDCSCSNMFMAAGSADRGGKLLLSDTELYLPDGIAGDCEKY